MKKICIILFILSIVALLNDSEASCRSSAVKRQFDKEQGYPHGRKGYVVDHICALVQGGLDSTKNMQYQTVEESHIKDKVEDSKYGRTLYCTPFNSTPTRQVFNCK